MIELTPWQKKKRARRMYVELLAVERRVKFDLREHMVEMNAIQARNREAHKKRQRVLAHLALVKQRKTRQARGLRFERGSAPRGSVSCQSRWVGTLAAMEPGRWYGRRVFIDREYTPKWGWFTLFLDQAVNPKRGPFLYGGEKLRTGTKVEPQYLWRLNKWGLALRAAVLREPRAERVNVLELEGARPDLW